MEDSPSQNEKLLPKESMAAGEAKIYSEL